MERFKDKLAEKLHIKRDSKIGSDAAAAAAKVSTPTTVEKSSKREKSEKK